MCEGGMTIKTAQYMDILRERCDIGLCCTAKCMSLVEKSVEARLNFAKVSWWSHARRRCDGLIWGVFGIPFTTGFLFGDRSVSQRHKNGNRKFDVVQVSSWFISEPSRWTRTSQLTHKAVAEYRSLLWNTGLFCGIQVSVPEYRSLL